MPIRTAILSFLIAASAAAQEKRSAAVSVTTRKGTESTKQQVGQYGICDTLQKWGLTVESRNGTAWDGHLEKAGVRVVGKEDKPGAALLSVEGAIELSCTEEKFYDEVSHIVYSAKVEIVVKDDAGKELGKIAWTHKHGQLPAKRDEVKGLRTVEMEATRLLLREIFLLSEIASRVPEDKKEAFKKFLAEEEKYWKEKTEQK